MPVDLGIADICHLTATSRIFVQGYRPGGLAALCLSPREGSAEDRPTRPVLGRLSEKWARVVLLVE